MKSIQMKTAHINKIINLDSSPQKLNNFIGNCRGAQLKDSNAVK